MRLFPAIDIQAGRCVRLRRGDFADETVFSEDPVEMAVRWVEQGANYLHVVDLDGARLGEPRNFELVRRMAEETSAVVQYGGGVRSVEALEMVTSSAVRRLVIGTSALVDEPFLEMALDLLGTGLVVAVDAEEGYVKTHGWRERSGMTARTFVRHLEELGLKEVIYTDISRDGMMDGISLRSIRELAEETDIGIIVSGGVTTLADLRTLGELDSVGVTGVIVGRSLYEGRFTVNEALEALTCS